MRRLGLSTRRLDWAGGNWLGAGLSTPCGLALRTILEITEGASGQNVFKFNP